MRKKIALLLLGAIMICTLIACGNENNASKNDTEISDSATEVVEEKEIDENILAVAESNPQFNNDEIIERANNRMKTEPEFYSGSKVPKIDSCVTGIVYDTENSGDGNYIYYFGEGADAKDKEVYLSAVCAYSAHLKALGLTYELNEGKMCYIYDGSTTVASFMIFETEEDGFMMIITPQ